MKEQTKLLLIIAIFACAYYIPWDHLTNRQSGLEAFMMLQEYARQHVLTCLIPAFFISGAIAVAGSSAAMVKGVLENSRWQGVKDAEGCPALNEDKQRLLQTYLARFGFDL